ncbi:MAG: hypothetical protein ACLFQB_13050 [Chitinispirillaceae bacterium]
MRRTDRRTICGLPYLLSFVLLTAAALCAAPLKATRQLTSNNIIELAGSGDTLWLATERGFNYQLDLGSEEWYGFEKDNHSFVSLAFGGGGAAALFYEESPYEKISFWYYDHEDDQQKESSFNFDYELRQKEDVISPNGLLYSSGYFWTACGSGGLIRFDPNSDEIRAFRPDNEGMVPEDLLPDTTTPNNTSVRAVSDFGNSSTLLVTSPSMLWTFDPSSSEWDTLVTDTVIASGDEFSSFHAAFTPLRGRDSVLYSYIDVKMQDTTETGLYRFGKRTSSWSKVLQRTPLLVSPAVEGYYYTVFKDNQLASYNDTLSDSADVDVFLDEQLDGSEFRNWLTKASNGVFPDVNDMLFIPESESAGTFLVATSGGLFIIDSEEPLSDSRSEAALVRYTRKITSKECYALPGVIRASQDGRYDRAVFVYRLKQDGDITIKVYDYNMSLVKTVVSGARREAENSIGRSTEPQEDYWDGTDGSGHMVSPGVYYFKITSTGGERFFGKVILAK